MRIRAALVGMTLSSAAFAGNDEGILMGNQPAMTGGAVTATISEGSAIWYNPAGVASVPTQSLDLSASAYGLRFYSASAFLQSNDGARAPVRVTELLTVPSALAYVRPLSKDLKFGFGIFVPRANDLVLRADLNTPSVGRWILAQAAYERLTYAGPSLGWSVSRTLRVGAALLGSLDFLQTELQFAGGDPSETASSRFFSSGVISTRTTVGAMLTAGVQWDVTPEWKLGLSVRSPAFSLWDSANDTSIVTGTLPGPDGTPVSVYTPDTSNTSRGSFSTTRPLQVRWGVARGWKGGGIALDGDVSPALRSAAEDPQDAKWNLRLGGLHQIGEEFMLGAGIFTDRDATPRDTTGAGPQHFYGGSAGVRWGKNYALRDPADGNFFHFTTTLALRYAYGSGDITSLRVSNAVSAAADESAVLGSTSIRIHEIAVHVGSALYF